MNGLLLQLLEDRQGSPGRWFWPCFEPLRGDFDAHFWLPDGPLWMGAPMDFFDENGQSDWTVQFEDLSVMILKPGSISRWGAEFCEEYLDLWAVKECSDLLKVATELHACPADETNRLIDRHAAIRLCYTDSACWEIFAEDDRMLDAVKRHVNANPAIRVFKTFSRNRAFGFKQIGWENWPKF